MATRTVMSAHRSGDHVIGGRLRLPACPSCFDRCLRCSRLTATPARPSAAPAFSAGCGKNQARGGRSRPANARSSTARDRGPSPTCRGRRPAAAGWPWSSLDDRPATLARMRTISAAGSSSARSTRSIGVSHRIDNAIAVSSNFGPVHSGRLRLRRCGQRD